MTNVADLVTFVKKCTNSIDVDIEHFASGLVIISLKRQTKATIITTKFLFEPQQCIHTEVFALILTQRRLI